MVSFDELELYDLYKIDDFQWEYGLLNELYYSELAMLAMTKYGVKFTDQELDEAKDKARSVMHKIRTDYCVKRK